jgi:hypothetical protein
VDFLAIAVGGSFFRRFESGRLAFNNEESLSRFRFVKYAQGVLPVFVPGNADEFVWDGRLFFPSGFPLAGTDLPCNGSFFLHG